MNIFNTSYRLTVNASTAKEEGLAVRMLVSWAQEQIRSFDGSLNEQQMQMALQVSSTDHRHTELHNQQQYHDVNIAGRRISYNPPADGDCGPMAVLHGLKLQKTAAEVHEFMLSNVNSTLWRLFKAALHRDEGIGTSIKLESHTNGMAGVPRVHCSRQELAACAL